MKLGTSLRFVFPTSPRTYAVFKAALDALPPGGFIERPMGALSTREQAQNLLGIADAARPAARRTGDPAGPLPAARRRADRPDGPGARVAVDRRHRRGGRRTGRAARGRLAVRPERHPRRPRPAAGRLPRVGRPPRPP